jgi:putative hydrolase of HD superfamily
MSSSDSNPSLSDVNSAASNSKRAIDFLTMARGLKTTKRTGWVMREVPQVESVADHSWRIALMAMVASQIQGEQVDVNKCIQMALVHDLAEAAVGDITPHCGVSDKEKHELELNAIMNMTGTLGGVLGGEQILKLWKEYEGGVTNEAKLVKDLDKLEMILQAQEYEEDGGNGKSLDQFFTSTRGKWNTEMGRQWAKEIEARRNMETNPKDETK